MFSDAKNNNFGDKKEVSENKGCPQKSGNYGIAHVHFMK